ncbi:hypothetical protein DFJ74DRAFT_702420 [Hyaloraphidium curvatum]|nr:hypothetical protein DFJ74DRAFT_702420 [Hyaloraphidium curvatum]
MLAVARRAAVAVRIIAAVLLVLVALAVLPSSDPWEPSAAPIRTPAPGVPQPAPPAVDEDDAESRADDVGRAETPEDAAGTVLLGRGPRSPRAAARLPAADWLRCATPAQGIKTIVEAASWTAEPVFGRAVVDPQANGGRGGNWTNFCRHGGALVSFPLTSGSTGTACVCPRRTAGARCERLLPIDPGQADALEAAENPDFGTGLDDDIRAVKERVVLCAGCPFFLAHALGQEAEMVVATGHRGILLENGSFVSLDEDFLADRNRSRKFFVIDAGSPANTTVSMPTWFRSNSTQLASLRSVLARRREPGSGSNGARSKCLGSATDALLCLIAWGDPRGGGELRLPAEDIAGWTGASAAGLESYYLGLNATCLGSMAVEDASLYGPWNTENDARYLHVLSNHFLRPPPAPPNSTDFLYCIYVTESRMTYAMEDSKRALLLFLDLLPSYYSPLRNKFAIHVDLKSSAYFRHSIELAVEALATANSKAGRKRNIWVVPEDMSFRGEWGDVSLVYMEASCWIFGMVDTYEEHGRKLEGPRGDWTHVMNLAGTDLGLWPGEPVDGTWLRAVREAMVRNGSSCIPLAGPASNEELTFVGLGVWQPKFVGWPLVHRSSPSATTVTLPDLDAWEPWDLGLLMGRFHRGPALLVGENDEVYGLGPPSYQFGANTSTYIFREATREDALQAAMARSGTGAGPRRAYQFPPRMRVLPPLRTNPPYATAMSQWHVLGRDFVQTLLRDREMRALLLGGWRTRPIPDEGFVTTAAISLVMRRKIAALLSNGTGDGPGGELCARTLKYWDWSSGARTGEPNATLLEQVLAARKAYWRRDDGGKWVLDLEAGRAAAGPVLANEAERDIYRGVGGLLLSLSARKLSDPRTACEMVERLTGRNGSCADLNKKRGSEGGRDELNCRRLANSMELVGLDAVTAKQVAPWEGFAGMACAG